MKRRPRVRTLLLVVGMIAAPASWAARGSRKVFAPAILSVEVASAPSGRPIAGDRLVRPDGTISLGSYGTLPVAGLTPHEIRRAVAAHLRPDLPGVTLDDVSVAVVFQRRPPSLVDWMTGKARLRQVGTLL